MTTLSLQMLGHIERAFERRLKEEESFGHFVVPNKLSSLLSANIFRSFISHFHLACVRSFEYVKMKLMIAGGHLSGLYFLNQ